MARLGGVLEQPDEALIEIGHVPSIRRQDLIRHHEQHRVPIGTHDGEQLAIVARIRHVAHAPIGEVRPQELSTDAIRVARIDGSKAASYLGRLALRPGSR